MSYYLGYPIINVYNVSFIGFVYILQKIWKETPSRLFATYAFPQQGLISFTLR